MSVATAAFEEEEEAVRADVSSQPTTDTAFRIQKYETSGLPQKTCPQAKGPIVWTGRVLTLQIEELVCHTSRFSKLEDYLKNH